MYDRQNYFFIAEKIYNKMPRKAFLLQGLTAHTHVEELKRLLAHNDLKRVLISVAFVTKGGIDLIASELASVGSQFDAFVGIRNGISTREGLTALMETGANVYYVDTGTTDQLFHPKVYVCRRMKKASVIIGSANLTVGGLNDNIESSIVLNLDLTEDGDLHFVESIFAEFDGLASTYPRHVVRIERIADLEALQAQGRLIDEASSSFSQGTVSTSKANDLPTIRLKVSPLRNRVEQPKVAQKLAPSDTVPEVDSTNPSDTFPLKLLWKSKALTERDLGIPSGENTHATGSINLDKGLLDKSIDHRHYFREKVFDTLSWKPSNRSTVEETRARFRLIVKGVDQGAFNMRVGHTISTKSKAYLQHNAMTRLSWGQAKEFVSRSDLVGRTMSLYRDKSDSTRFVIKID